MLGSGPPCGRLPALSEVVKLPTHSLVPPARQGDGMAAAPAAPGRLLLPGTSDQTVCLLSHKHKGWSKVVLPAGCLVNALPGAQEAPARTLLSADDSCTAPTTV